ncbi:MAG TPA: hypothetical protein VFZ97_06650 [Acidimicrobiales bacterium]
MAGAAGAMAERALRERHRDQWPRNLYVYDRDEIRTATGRKLLLETPGGDLSVAAEYKSVEDGELDLSGLQFKVVAGSVHEKLPALAIQFTHPPNHPWAFRLWPLNKIATAFAPVELTEQRYVQLLYLLQRGTASAGGAVTLDGAEFAPWEELAHLDDAWPPESPWPTVKEAFPDETSGKSPGDLFLQTAQEFAVRRGRDPVPNRKLADVELLLAKKAALGAFKSEATQETAAADVLVPVAAPVSLKSTTQSRDRFDRLCYQLDRFYGKMWLEERPSNDGRDMWSPWDEDGKPRWQRPSA